MKFSPIAALVMSSLAAFAQSAKLPSTANLHTHPKVLEEVQAEIDRVNAKLTRVCQVRKFTIMPTTLTVEKGELTPTLKVKRKVVMERQCALIDAMYADGDH